ncbi:hypothetical protein [Spongiimicrobium salis]|uniref:hypothetical protein n=1 Tax=Spongiimicrobium salis TaxID=1667022 RepID=UPI00374D8BA8
MKTYFPFLCICCFFLLNSCKPLHNLNLTTTNYIYEGELYQAYLNAEILMVEETIDELQGILDNNQGNAQTEADLAANLEKKSSLNNELAGIPGLVSFSIVPPKPPCPVEDRTCLPKDFRYLLFPASTVVSKIQIFTEEGQEILTVVGGTTTPVADTEGQLKAQLIDKQLSSGNVRVKIFRKDFQNNEIDFEVKAAIVNQ